ncbi:MAG: bifunctional UDP-N-acetylmuramoyl-tripeptide:D-alanyl-D-alanine ligase/alanine racemase [Chitinophagales bacterium]
MIYTAEEICEILECRGQIVRPEAEIEHLLTDSRNIIFGDRSLFFAISGKNHDGHQYISQAIEAGVKNFVVEKVPENSALDINYFQVDNSITALQQLAIFHRREFNIPVLGITGSNGKTIVKEWIYHLLKIEFDIVRSPKSYNSQIGVPLSVLAMDEKNDVAIFEAGISLPGEMEKLEKIIQPTIGLITNITQAHNEGFLSEEEKTKEKLLLFQGCKIVIYRKDHQLIDKLLPPGLKTISWSTESKKNADVLISGTVNSFSLHYKNDIYQFNIPFTDEASFENCVNAILAALIILEEKNHLNHATKKMLEETSADLPPVSMRMELKKAINNSLVINDSYSADPASLEIALSFLNNHSESLNKTVILTDFDESGQSEDVLYKTIAALLKKHKVKNFIGIGESISASKNYFTESISVFYKSPDEFIRTFNERDFTNNIILVKGARRFHLERISNLLEQKTHGTVLTIDLNNLLHNLNVYRSLLKPGVKTMAMVKAFSYGSGQAEIARLLAHHRVDYLAVAYADEGVDLRRQGIKVPIMVMNPEPDTFNQMLQYDLEPEIYSKRILDLFIAATEKNGNKKFNIHIKLDTGMHRLGFEEKDIDELVEIITSNKKINVTSIFSHLSSADDERQNEFTLAQINLFNALSKRILSGINENCLRHILNSPGINKFPDAQFEMVRLGIGLYGVDPSSSIQNKLLTVSKLTTNIAQVKEIKPGDSVGYGRSFIAEKNMRIATINIGYADGFSRKMGNGSGQVFIHGKLAPVVGRVCMDMTMVDISEIPGVNEGDEVEIFGDNISIIEHAIWQDTIPYEVMTGISHRVKRVYVQE